jgi:alpha-maltose-1-phosphate synthase
LKVSFLTREFPPEVYGGAGVYAEHLAADLARLVDLKVHCFGEPRSGDLQTVSYRAWEALDGSAPHLGALQSVSVDLAMAAALEGTDLVHSNTWYTNMAGHLAKLLYKVPHVATAHSLEPLRAWKAEQLGGGYAVSSFCEKTALEAADAVIGVSEQMRRDVLRCYPSIDPDRVVVVHNGIDTETYRPVSGTGTLVDHGIDPEYPIILFVGRITRQKGIIHLLKAAELIPAQAQIVLCAAAPDTVEIAREFQGLTSELKNSRGNVFWIERMLPRPELMEIFSAATAFVCPSVYEPFGLVNVEAMACETAVVATATGGIPEIVVEGETGFLVPPGPTDPVTGEPDDPSGFAAGLAERINRLLDDPRLARQMGRAGRTRAIEHFSWAAAAQKTVAIYRSVSTP